MNYKRFERNRKSRIKAQASEASRVIARETSRRKPEDIQKARFLYGIGVVVANFFKRIRGLFHFRSRKYRPPKHVQGFFGRGNKTFFSRRAKRLASRHYGEIPFAPNRRQLRRFCMTGYWNKPRAEHLKKPSETPAIEVIGKTSSAHWRKPKAEV